MTALGLHFFGGWLFLFLLYADTSGNAELSDGTSSVTAFVAVCIHESNWRDLEYRFEKLKTRYAFPGIPMELHAKEICQVIKEQDKIPGFLEMDRSSRREAVLAYRRERLEGLPEGQRQSRISKSKASDPYIHLSRSDRNRLFEDALDLVGSMDGIRLFGEVITKEYLSQLQGEDYDPIKQSLEQVVSRFDRFIRYYNGTNPDSPNRGMLILDNEPTSEDRIKSIVEKIRRNGHPWGAVDYVIEAPFFVDSATVSAIQVADVCAYAVRRHVEHLFGRFEKENLMRIFHRFDRGAGRLHGIRHYCASNTCFCEICLTRGHFRPVRAGQ